MVAKQKAPANDKNDKEEVNLGKVLGFMRLLWAVDHGLQSMSKRMSANLGVTGLQRMVIRIVGRFPEISAGELAEVLHVHPSTLTGVLDKLLRRGAIERIADPADARRALLTLTSKGQDLDEVRSGTVEAAIRKALGRVSSKQIAAAEEVLEALVTELNAAQEK